MDRLHLLWINDQVTLFTDSGEVRTDSGWSEPDAERLGLAIRQLGFKGKSAVVVYEGEYISHHELEVPPLDDAMTLALIQRRMPTELQGADPAGRVGFMRAADNRRVLIEVLDSRFYDALVEAFRVNGMTLDLVCGLTPVLARMAAGSGHDSPMLVEFADRDAGMNFMLYYHAEKRRPALFRVAPLAWDPEHLEQDMRRSIQLGRQLFAGREPEVFLVGDPEFVTEGVTHLGEAEALLDAVARLPVQSTANLVPPEDRGMAKQRLRMYLALALLVPFVLGSLAVHIVLDHKIGEYRAALSDIRELMHERERYLERIGDYERRNRFIRDAGRTDILPAVVLANVGNDLPWDFTLRRFECGRAGPVGRMDGEVSFRLGGEVDTDPVHAPELLRRLEARFGQPPYNGRVIHSWREYWLKAIQTWSNARNGGGAGIPFEIEVALHE